MVIAGYDFVISNIKNMKPGTVSRIPSRFLIKYVMTKATLLNKIFEQPNAPPGADDGLLSLKRGQPPDEELF